MKIVWSRVLFRYRESPIFAELDVHLPHRWLVPFVQHGGHRNPWTARASALVHR